MGRNKTNTSRDFFTYHKTENKSICNICDTSMIGNHAANLERHLKRHHSNEFKTVQQKKKIKLNIRDEATPSTSGSSGSQETLDKYVKSEFLKVKLNKEIVLKACI
ncbi:zinc finger BED domain-containing protein 4 [Trichonephila clavata]|nr:zinc finger BED domain-containing protein 4 [Trichonephila clavata]